MKVAVSNGGSCFPDWASGKQDIFGGKRLFHANLGIGKVSFVPDVPIAGLLNCQRP